MAVIQSPVVRSVASEAGAGRELVLYGTCRDAGGITINLCGDRRHFKRQHVGCNLVTSLDAGTAVLKR